MNLFINYYNAGSRQDEIDYCLKKNLENPLIKRVVALMVKGVTEMVEHPKLTIIYIEDRPTYQRFFNETRKYEGVNIIANSDIFFDETLEYANRIKEKQCYALTRWEFDGKESRFFEDVHGTARAHCPGHYSQDVWIFRNGCIMEDCENVIAQRTNRRVYDTIKFTIGIPGCDNVIAAKLKTKYDVSNPSLTIKAHHYHLNQKRNPYSHRITGHRSQWGIIARGKVNPVKI